jgi:hypothetical protein
MFITVSVSSTLDVKTTKRLEPYLTELLGGLDPSHDSMSLHFPLSMELRSSLRP